MAMKRYDITNRLVVFRKIFVVSTHYDVGGITWVTGKSADMMLGYFRPDIMRIQGECEALCRRSMGRSEG